MLYLLMNDNYNCTITGRTRKNDFWTGQDASRSNFNASLSHLEISVQSDSITDNTPVSRVYYPRPQLQSNEAKVCDRFERHSLCLHNWMNRSIPYFVLASTKITNKVRRCTFYLHNQYRYRHPITGLNGPLGFQEVEVPRISRQSTHETGKVVSPTHRPPLSPSIYPLYSFMSEARSTPGPYCCRKD